MTIQLLKGRAIVRDKEIHTIAENAPFIAGIESDTAYSDLYAVCLIANKKHTFKINDGVLRIEPKYLRSGDMAITIAQTKDGKVLNSWLCEKITLKEAEGGFEPIPEIKELRNEIKILRRAIAEIKNFIEKKSTI